MSATGLLGGCGLNVTPHPPSPSAANHLQGRWTGTLDGHTVTLYLTISLGTDPTSNLTGLATVDAMTYEVSGSYIVAVQQQPLSPPWRQTAYGHMSLLSGSQVAGRLIVSQNMNLNGQPAGGVNTYNAFMNLPLNQPTFSGELSRP